MKSKNRRIYRSVNPVKIVLNTIVIVVVILIILGITIFFGFQKYIVYTPDGLSLDVPWLEDTVNTTDNAI